MYSQVSLKALFVLQELYFLEEKTSQGQTLLLFVLHRQCRRLQVLQIFLRQSYIIS
jgi:hypothetical protein